MVPKSFADIIKQTHTFHWMELREREITPLGITFSKMNLKFSMYRRYNDTFTYQVGDCLQKRSVRAQTCDTWRRPCSLLYTTKS